VDLRLNSKIALVTAASAGLGLATAKQLLAEGAQVVVCGRSLARLEQAYAAELAAANNNLVLIEADLAAKSSIENLVDETVSKYQGIDILITNNGGPPHVEFETATDEQWDAANQGIVKSAVDLINASLPYLKKSNATSILTITSVSVKQPLPGLLLSNVYRPAVIGLTKTLAKELGEYQIRVNSILPGYTLTKRLESVLPNDAAREQITQKIPLGRMGEPEEFARTAVFLVSPAASYITGVMLPVDGGFCEGLC